MNTRICSNLYLPRLRTIQIRKNLVLKFSIQFLKLQFVIRCVTFKIVSEIMFAR